MKKLVTLFFACLSIAWLNPVSAQYHLIVAADGSGHFTSISSAISAVVAAAQNGDLTGRARIFVKNGVYNEPVRFGTHKTGYTNIPVSLIGESRDGVIIQYNNYQYLIDNTYPDRTEGYDYYYGTAQCATMTINAEDFYAENFTVRNTKDTSVYTTGLYIAGRRQAYKNIKVEAKRGAVYIRNGRPAFIMDSNIKGTQEMTCSNGTVVVYNSIFKTDGFDMSYSIPEDNVYYAVLGDGDTLRYGHIFRHCSFTANDTASASSMYLAVPKSKNSSAMYMNCTLGAHINPVAIKTSSNALANLYSYFGEYNNIMADGVTPVDVTQRASNVRQMTDEVVQEFVYNNKIYNDFLSADVLAADPDTVYFDPLKLVAPKGIPQNVTKNGTTLAWDAVEDAIGYVIYMDSAYVGMSEANTFEATGTGTYTVCSVSESGALSKSSASTSQQTYEELIAILNNNISNYQAINTPETTTFSLVVSDGVISFENETNCNVFNLSGQCLLSKTAQTEVSLKSFPKGVYIVKTMDAVYGNNITKIVR